MNMSEFGNFVVRNMINCDKACVKLLFYATARAGGTAVDMKNRSHFWFARHFRVDPPDAPFYIQYFINPFTQ